MMMTLSLCRQDIESYYPNKFIQRDDTDRFYILNTLFNLSGLKFIFSRSFLCTNYKFHTLDQLLLQRRTSTAASWTSSPDATDTQSESSWLVAAGCMSSPGPPKVHRRLQSCCLSYLGVRMQTRIDFRLKAPLLSLRTSSLPASRKASNTATCSCPSEACTTTSATPWTLFTTRWAKGLKTSWS